MPKRSSTQSSRVTERRSQRRSIGMRLFDATVMVNLALSDQQLRQELKTGLKNGIDSDTGLTGQLVKNSQQGGKIDFLRTRQNHGRQVVPLFRMIQPSADWWGSDTLNLFPKRFADGKIRAAVDLYVFSAASSFRRPCDMRSYRSSPISRGAFSAN